MVDIDRVIVVIMVIFSLIKGDVVLVRVGILCGGNVLECNQYIRIGFFEFKLF